MNICLCAPDTVLDMLSSAAPLPPVRRHTEHVTGSRGCLDDHIPAHPGTAATPSHPQSSYEVSVIHINYCSVRNDFPKVSEWHKWISFNSVNHCLVNGVSVLFLNVIFGLKIFNFGCKLQ